MNACESGVLKEHRVIQKFYIVLNIIRSIKGLNLPYPDHAIGVKFTVRYTWQE